jgi:uncharacterized protein YciI
MHFVLIYEVGEDFVERRAKFREEHLALAWRAADAGELVLAGALGEPADQALLLFDSATPEAAERFAAADPYVQNGLVKRWRVRPWTTVVGRDASAPKRPGR